MRWLIILCLFPSWAMAQSIGEFQYLGDDYHNETYIGLAYSNSNLSNPDAPNPHNHRISGPTFFLDMKHVRLKPGQCTFIYRNKLIGDLFLLLNKAIQNSNAVNRSESSMLSTGILGWFDFRWNLNEPKRFQPTAGFSLRDYFVGTSYDVDTVNGLVSWEPQGYWFTVGPTAGFRALPVKQLMVTGDATYTVGFAKGGNLSYAEKDPDYPNPHFMHTELELQTTWGVYAGWHQSWLINRGDLPNNTRRSDFVLGFRFML